MIIYCNCLTVGACVKVIQLCWRNLFSRQEAGNIQVLDPLPNRGWSAMLRTVMQGLGFRVEEAEFFAGSLRAPDGKVVFMAARMESMSLAFQAAERILARSKVLKRLNHEWGRNTILKYIAGTLEIPALQVALRFMAADVLGHATDNEKVFLVVQRHSALDPDLLRALSPGLKVYFYRSWLCQFSRGTFIPSGSYEFLKQKRACVLFLLLFLKLREVKWSIEALVGRGSNVQDSFNGAETSSPSLLVLQEDDLSLDRSYRTQPHWFFPEDGKAPFRTLVLQTGSLDRLPVDNEALKEHGIIPVSQKELNLLSRRLWFSHPIQKNLHRGFWKCALASVFGSSLEVGVVFEVARLLYTANVLAAFCERNHVKAFMTCENYMVEGNAMSLIAPPLNITTISYQYSNAGKVGPIMMTTADIMLTFAPLYHQRWARDGVWPGAFADMGYLYDTSFEYVRRRARGHRRRLAKAGAQFVICYFDESVQWDKYGLISDKDHCAQILTLLRLVLDDPSIGVVVKTQFQHNSPQNFEEITTARAAAKATGRYIELVHGTHRNIIFPAEAALSADMAIGHSVGATAGLEAALAGVRCILLNPYGMRDDNTTLYEQADVVYPSMATALEAIRDFRSGVPDSDGIGDWSPIIGQYDPFRDGRAGHRMRELLERLVLRESAKAAALSRNAPVNVELNAFNGE